MLHLAIQVAEIPLSKIMQNLSFRYTRWFNRRQERMGHLFQGRYKAILVDRDAYLLELVRYIHLNPVRASMVKDVMDHEWSGHRAYAGVGHLPWSTEDYVLGHFADDVALARERYVTFVHGGVADGHRQEFHQGNGDSRLLGDDRFMEAALAHLPICNIPAPRLDEIIACVCQQYQVEKNDLVAKGRTRRMAEARAVTGWLAIELTSATLSDVAMTYGRDIATLSGALRKVRERAQKESEFSVYLDNLRKAVLHATANKTK